MGGAINEKATHGNLYFRRFGVRHFYRMYKCERIDVFGIGKRLDVVLEHAVREHVGSSQLYGIDGNGGLCS